MNFNDFSMTAQHTMKSLPAEVERGLGHIQQVMCYTIWLKKHDDFYLVKC